MSGFIDLHTHTTASDGSMTPEELVRHAKNRGLSAVAITDHDTVGGIAAGLAEGEAAGIEVIAGVEISVAFKPEMHMLGYFSQAAYTNIKDTLDTLRKNREERNPKIIKKLNGLGFDISLEEVKKEALGDVVGRPHIAKVMVGKGYADSLEEVFDKYLASGRPAYFKKDKLTPREGIEEILKAGGVPVLAHPIFLGLDSVGLDHLLYELKDAGLKGMEVHYVENTEEDTRLLLELAQGHELLITGGSDFHGGFKENIEIGAGRGNLKIPYVLLEELKRLMRQA